MFRDLYYRKTTIDDVERKEDGFNGTIGVLENYIPRNNKYVEAKNKFLNDVNNFYKGTEKIIEVFKDKIFPFCYDKDYEYEMKIEREVEEEQKKKQDEKTTNSIKFNDWINKEEKGITNELFKKKKIFKGLVICWSFCTQQKIKQKRMN